MAGGQQFRLRATAGFRGVWAARLQIKCVAPLPQRAANPFGVALAESGTAARLSGIVEPVRAKTLRSFSSLDEDSGWVENLNSRSLDFYNSSSLFPVWKFGLSRAGKPQAPRVGRRRFSGGLVGTSGELAAVVLGKRRASINPYNR